MKKILILLILLHGHLYAVEKESTLKVYHEVFLSLLDKHIVYVYTEDKEYREIFKTSDKIILTKNLEKADIVLITNHSSLFHIKNKLENGVVNKPVMFVTDYRLLKYSPDIVGAFYWKKGRSQLLFIKNRLDTFNIALPDAYENFTVETI